MAEAVLGFCLTLNFAYASLYGGLGVHLKAFTIGNFDTEYFCPAIKIRYHRGHERENV